MINEKLLKRIEKLENELQDLTDKLKDVTMTVIALIGIIDPEGFEGVGK